MSTRTLVYVGVAFVVLYLLTRPRAAQATNQAANNPFGITDPTAGW